MLYLRLYMEAEACFGVGRLRKVGRSRGKAEPEADDDISSFTETVLTPAYQLFCFTIVTYFDSMQILFRCDHQLSKIIYSRQDFPVDNACGHRRPRHWMSRLCDCPLSATERFPSPRHEHGTVCQSK